MPTMNATDPGELLSEEAMAEVNSTVGWMLERMQVRNQHFALLRSYYQGLPPMPWVHAKAESMYRLLLKQAVCNFPLLVVDTVCDRLAIDGFRLDAPEADAKVWNEVWQANQMDVFAPQLHREALITGIGYVSVQAKEGKPIVRCEVSEEVFHDADPEDPARVKRAVKVWADIITKTKQMRVVNEMTVLYFQAPYDPQAEVQPDLYNVAWTLTGVLPNTSGKVPFVPFYARPQLGGGFASEIEDVLPGFDKINTLTAQMLLAAELGAFKIRWATGIEIPTDVNGDPVEPFDVALNRLWVNQDPEGNFGSFDGTPLDPYLKSISEAVSQVAAISRTPPFLLMGQLTNLSADALKATESGLVQKVYARQATFGQSWQGVVRLALEVLGDDRADDPTIEVIWRDPENVSEAQRVDALTKLYAIGLPWGAVMERYGATPGEIKRWEEMRSEDLFQRMLLSNASNGAPGLATSATIQGTVERDVATNPQAIESAPDAAATGAETS